MAAMTTTLPWRSKLRAPMHDAYEEICAAAAIGQACPQDLARLHDHLRHCSRCRHAYSEFTTIVSRVYVENPRAHLIFPQHEAMLPNADVLRDRFLCRARKQEVIFDQLLQTKPSHSDESIWHLWRHVSFNAATVGRVAAVLALILPSAYELGRRAAIAHNTPIAGYSAQVLNVPPSGDISNLRAQHKSSVLQIQIASLKQDLTSKEHELESLRQHLKGSSEDVSTLRAAQARLETSQDEVKRQLQERDLLAEKQARDEEMLLQQISELKTALNAAQASYVADEIRIRDLTEEVASKSVAAERNAELLDRDRDIRDLMTARNLHIFDVFDTDAKGKTKPAFGRIFYTEGKSLIFYAYDLNEARPTSAGFHYRVWGSREAEKNKATSLGLFYSDDKAQRRWVFKCNDPKILRQIDSVFVTIEHNSSDSPYPKGQKLLDAYLGGVANHP
jgi:acyl transferase domain-containing protein